MTEEPKLSHLELMMQMQRMLQKESFGTDPTTLTGEERIQFFKEMKLALQDELHEALNEMGWKPWATSKHWNEDAVKGELVDAWHFMMNLFLVANMDFEELFARYMKKHNINVERQIHGYDGVSEKCPECKRALDDDAVTCHKSVYFEGLDFCCHFDVMSDAS